MSADMQPSNAEPVESSDTVENDELHLSDLDDTSTSISQYEEAISTYSKALKSCGDVKGYQTRYLCQRSIAFARLSKRLRAIPAAASERRALLQLDPFHLAQLALKDAAKAAELAPTAKAFDLQGRANLLLESYGSAEASFLAGLSIDPTDKALLEGLELVQQHVQTDQEEGGRQKRARVTDRQDDFECILCMKLLYQPVTTPCGHTFCKDCFQRAADHSTKCPLCRTVLHVGRQISITLTLHNIIERSFPAEFAERRAEMEAHEGSLNADERPDAPVPLFVMCCMMPGEKMQLNIFEPRYRLLVRRCMEGNRRFGMATVNQLGQLSEIACQGEILECTHLPDGRFYLEIEGRRRFKVLESWEQDGYRAARPQFFQDNPPAEGTPDNSAVQAMCQSVDDLATIWLDKVRAIAVGGRHSRFVELVARAGSKPALTDPEAFSFWIANLIPLNSSDKYKLLSMTSSHDRLKFEHEKLKGSSPGVCCIM